MAADSQHCCTDGRWPPGLTCRNGLMPPPPPLCAGDVIPDLPPAAKEGLGLLLNGSPIRSVDFFASKATGWWGVSVQLQATVVGIGPLLGAFSFIAQMTNLPSPSSFKPRLSIAGKLSGNGLPIAIGERPAPRLSVDSCCGGDKDEGLCMVVPCSTTPLLECLPPSQAWTVASPPMRIPGRRCRLRYGYGQLGPVALLLRFHQRLPERLPVHHRQGVQVLRRRLHQPHMVRLPSHQAGACMHPPAHCTATLFAGPSARPACIQQFD